MRNPEAPHVRAVRALDEAFLMENETRLYYEALTEAYGNRRVLVGQKLPTARRIADLGRWYDRLGVARPPLSDVPAPRLSRSWPVDLGRAVRAEVRKAVRYDFLVSRAGISGLSATLARLGGDLLYTDIPRLRRHLNSSLDLVRNHGRRGIPASESEVRHGEPLDLLELIGAVFGADHSRLETLRPWGELWGPSLAGGLLTGAALGFIVAKVREDPDEGVNP